MSRRVSRATSFDTRSTRSPARGRRARRAGWRASSGCRPADCAARARPRRPARRWRRGARRAPGCAAARAAVRVARRTSASQRRGARAVRRLELLQARARRSLSCWCSGSRNGSTSVDRRRLKSPSARRASCCAERVERLDDAPPRQRQQQHADGEDGERRRQLEAQLRDVLALELRQHGRLVLLLGALRFGDQRRALGELHRAAGVDQLQPHAHRGELLDRLPTTP